MMTLVIGAALTWLPLSGVPFSAGVAWIGYVPWFDKDGRPSTCCRSPKMSSSDLRVWTGAWVTELR